MQTIILAGGLGTRLAEETEVRPKPLVEIGHQPILWHILKHYSYYGHNEFFIALGYKGEMIKRYFLDYSNLSGQLTIDMKTGRVISEQSECEPWTVHLVDTGQKTNTGGRVKRLAPFLKKETFFITYGDGVSNINLDELLAFHRSQKKMVTITAVRPPARFGGLEFDGDLVMKFTEKPQTGEGWINGGFMVCEPELLDVINNDLSSLEADVLDYLASINQISAYRHFGFWQCMDTLRDKKLLEQFWQDGNAPWKIWE
ncbi:glucose-1-phosphate cytidylyltransferase [Leptolinea tardivitalis]|uniref:Glucose-1-phosphate cytidylyltransferase n=1 Tax=Leptolinea tardivitalis TaxID=229920 RepID=A0A0P6WN06_9CHLR|nr:glucose-1-phosphate cytidylyltransferase [Leptolinea tardivitalis]KPL70204.1 glucose-1-phosphate cytidylyltransferase [Leptolinea tardivitalis]GAP21739.1 glucose-1-phosphate cytidylyltransferase [Leptolinea tardivitalis]